MIFRTSIFGCPYFTGTNQGRSVWSEPGCTSIGYNFNGPMAWNLDFSQQTFEKIAATLAKPKKKDSALVLKGSPTPTPTHLEKILFSFLNVKMMEIFIFFQGSGVKVRKKCVKPSPRNFYVWELSTKCACICGHHDSRSFRDALRTEHGTKMYSLEN